MKLEVFRACDLTTAECDALRSLTLRDKGELRDALTDWRYDEEAKVIRLTDDAGRVLSWGLIHPYDSKGNKDFQVYTRASERRKGYGKMVYDKAVQIARGRTNLIVHPHSVASVEYFNNLHYKPAGLPEYNFALYPKEEN